MVLCAWCTEVEMQYTLQTSWCGRKVWVTIWGDAHLAYRRSCVNSQTGGLRWKRRQLASAIPWGNLRTLVPQPQQDNKQSRYLDGCSESAS
jgi:hypothetical protein